MSIRRILRGLPCVLVAMMILLAAPSRAADSCDRACRINAGNTYLAALVSHNGDAIPLADDAQRYENGSNTGNGAQAIRDGVASPIMYVITGIQDLHWEVEGQDAVATYYLDTVAPTYIVERFTVGDDGLISLIVAHFYIDTSGYVQGPESVATNPNRQVTRFTAYSHGPLGPVPVSAGNTGDDALRPASSCGRACVADAVNAFLGAMETHDASTVPLGDGAAETVNHRPVADIVAALEADNGIRSITNPTVIVDGTRAVAQYDIVLDGATYHGATRFLVEDGLIREIYAVCDGSETCTA